MFGVIIAILVHRFIPKGGWLIVHMVTLGLITNSILIWSQHFTEALMKIKSLIRLAAFRSHVFCT